MIDLSLYKAILFDVDKTLTNSKKDISTRTLDAISLARTKGLTVGICTGRQYPTLKSTVLSHFHNEELHVVGGGSFVITSKGDVRWKKALTWNTTSSIVELMTRYGAKVLIQSGDTIFGNEYATKVWFVQEKNPLSISPFIELEPTEVGLLTASDIREELLHELERIPNITVKKMRGYSGNLYLDITARGVTKALGITEWCALQGVNQKQIIGFGDSENDIEFLSSVGYSIAMGNAVDALKKLATEVTLSCDEDGVAKWIEQNVS